jgi:ATP-binding protein involved in chromosome partitioning
MADMTREQVEAAIQQYADPYLGTDLVDARAVKDINVEGGKVVVDVELGFPAEGYKADLAAALAEKIKAAGASDVTVHVTWKVVEHAVQKGVPALPGVKNIIAVASGKGGVGKSTTAVNLALALAAEGATVGVLDADIYGPSQPRMLGAAGAKPESTDGKKLEPVTSYNIQSMSIGYLIEEDTPMIWRGPMVTQALEQLLKDTNWKGVDYLIVDMPPGTGDTQLTLAQKIPVSGAVIVSTPQDIALLDALKGLRMFEKVEVPVLGIVENMGLYVCPSCGHEDHIFAQGGAEKMATDEGVAFLGSLPLNKQIREDADNGKPTVVADPASPLSAVYREVARRTVAKLAMQKKNYAAKFPNIVIQ